jgi:hypothetical protein
MLQEGRVSKAQRNQQRTHIGIGGERLQGADGGGRKQGAGPDRRYTRCEVRCWLKSPPRVYQGDTSCTESSGGQ